MSSKNIAKEHYPRERSPINAVRSVVTTLNNLIVKIKRNKECFTIMKTDRRGPFPIEFWIEEKNISQRDRQESSRERHSL